MVSSASLKETDRMQFAIRYIGLATLAGAVIGIPAILFPSLILSLFDPEYASAASTLQILGIYLILIGVGQVASQYLIFVRMERAYSLVVMATGVLALGLYLVCIPLWSAKGAALAVLISHGTAIGAYLIMTFRHIHSVRKSEADLLLQAPPAEI
jgi:O-antigen/teichoic acid export membrane protein